MDIGLKLCIMCGADKHKTFFGDQHFGSDSFADFHHKTNLKTFFCLGDQLTRSASKELNFKDKGLKIQPMSAGYK